MNVTIFAYSLHGCDTARKAAACFADSQVRQYTVARLALADFCAIPQPSSPFYGECFACSDALVFVGSCGIAVREIAPYLQSKRTDPAVVVVDERANFVIPLLSGHIGGANALASCLAEVLGATAVITTATDVNHRFSVDAWAARNGYVLEDMTAAKAVSTAILEHDVPMLCELPRKSAYPSGVVEGSSGALGIYVGYRARYPFDCTLQIVPKVLHLGIGCRRGTSTEAISQAVQAVFQTNGLDMRAIKCAASIDLKQNEQGLLEACAVNGWPVHFYSAQQLSQVSGRFTPSVFVQSVTGVDNVCERAACLGAEKLLVPKIAQNGVTVAIAAERVEVSFE